MTAEGEGLRSLPHLSMIPRIVHRIWLDDPMPDPFAGFGDRWAALNPGWEVVDWRTSALLPALSNQDLFDRAEELYPKDWKRFQADLVRLELLWQFGGVYVDTDSEPVTPLDDLLGSDRCVVGRSPQHINGHHPITNAFMASVRRHPWIGALIDGAPEAIRKYGRRSLAQSVGPWHLTRTYESGDWPDVAVHDDLYAWAVKHHWNTAARKRGEGL